MPSHFEGGARKISPAHEELDNDLAIEELSDEEADRLAREGKARWAKFEDLEDLSGDARRADGLTKYPSGIHHRAETLRSAFDEGSREEFTGRVRVVHEATHDARLSDDISDNEFDLERLRSTSHQDEYHDDLTSLRWKLNGYQPFNRGTESNDWYGVSGAEDAHAFAPRFNAVDARKDLATERTKEGLEEGEWRLVVADLRPVVTRYEHESQLAAQAEAESRRRFIQDAEEIGEVKASFDRMRAGIMAEKEALVREAAEAAEKLRAEQRNTERKASAARRSVYHLAALVLSGVLGRGATVPEVQDFMRDHGVNIAPAVEAGTRAIDYAVERYAAPALEVVADGVRGVARGVDRLTIRDEREEPTRQQAAEAAEARALINRFDQLFQRSERSGESYDERVDRFNDAFSTPGAWELLVAHRRELSIPAENELMMTLLVLRDRAQDAVLELEDSELDTSEMDLADARRELSRYKRLVWQMGPEPIGYDQRDPTDQQLERQANRE